MPSNSSHPVIATRISPERKARFEALASTHGQTVSALLDQLIYTVLAQNPVVAATQGNGAATERLSLRLRPGDRELLNARAAKRDMKPASYAVMLLRAHLRGRAPLPTAELNTLKVAVGELSSVGRNLNQLTKMANAGQAPGGGLRDTLQSVRDQVAELRESVAALVRANLISWEAGDA